MTTSLFLLIVVLLISCLLIFHSYRKVKDFFHPKVFVVGYFLLTSVPYLFMIACNPESFHNSTSVLLSLKVTPDNAISNYLLIQLLYFLCLYAGMSFSKKQNNNNMAKSRIAIDNLYISMMFRWTLIVSVVCFIMFYFTNGGLINILSQFSSGERSKLVTESLFSHVLFMSLPILAALTQCMYIIKRFKKGICALILGYCLFVSSLSGGRGGSLTIIIIVLAISNYMGFKLRIKHFVKYSFLLILIIPFFVLLPKLRSIDIDVVMENPTLLLEKDRTQKSNSIEQWADLSRAYIPIFIVDYFDVSNFWYGRSFQDLFQGLIPRAFFEDKPPVDDGRYIFRLAIGDHSFVPSIPAKQFVGGSSWPPRTLGSWYANFGVLGIIIAAIIMGRIYIHFYNKIYENLFYLLLYPSVLFLQLSNLGIVNFCIHVIVLYSLLLLSKIFYKRRVAPK